MARNVTKRSLSTAELLDGFGHLVVRPIALGAAGETRTAIPALARSRIKSPAENEKLDPAAMQCRIGRIGRRPISISLSQSAQLPKLRTEFLINVERDHVSVFLSMSGIRRAAACQTPKNAGIQKRGGERTTRAKRQPKPEQDARQNNGLGLNSIGY